MGILLFTLGLFVGLPIGLLAGAAAWWWFNRRQAEGLKSAFALLAQEQLERNTQHLLTLAQEKLGDKQEGLSKEVTANLTTIKTEIGQKMETVTALMQTLEKDREGKFATLTQTITHTAENLGRLQATTADLTAALANSRTRGQWGERMAEDVLANAGLHPGINYRKQSTLSGTEGTRRPDFTFLLPDKRVLHMDVKFPLDDYRRWHQAQDDAGRAEAAKKFLAATRTHIRSTAARAYHEAATAPDETSLDYLLIFIPNEQIYAFLLETDQGILNEAVAQKVILCSPTTLLAVLAVIRQSMQSFNLNRQAREVYGLLTGIREQWDKFTESMAAIGDKLSQAQKAFETTTTTRTKQLDRQFAKLDNLAAPQPEAENGQPTSLLESTLPPLAATAKPN